MVVKTSLIIPTALAGLLLATATTSSSTSSAGGIIVGAEARKRAATTNNNDKERLSYHHAGPHEVHEDTFDAAFYDRQAPNEASDNYRAEQLRRGARKPSSSSTALAHATKEEQIMVLEDDLHELRATRLASALEKSTSAEAAYLSAKANMAWFPSREEKERLVLLENNLRRHSNELAVVQEEERALEARIKPLYGIVSRQFWNEQRRAISESIDTVHKMAKDNAWYSTLFSIGKVDSLQDLIMHAISQYFIAGIILYCFSIIYFALWTAPWTVWAYSSSIVDVVPGLLSYLLAVLLILSPIIVTCLAFAAWVSYKNNNGDVLAPVRPYLTRAMAGFNTNNGGGGAQQQQRRPADNTNANVTFQRPTGAAGGFGGTADLD